MKYNKIILALSICPSAFGGNEEFYKQRFADFIITCDADYINKLKDEIQDAISDDTWSWKEACRVIDFFSFDSDGSEESHFKDVKAIMWSVLFGNDFIASDNKIEKYNNLINALQAFEEDWMFDLGIEGCRASLERQKENGLLNFELVKSEYKDCFSNPDFDWKLLAQKSLLFSDLNLYSNWQIRAIIEFYLEEFIFPEQILTTEEKAQIEKKLNSVLKSNNDWIEVEDLLKIIHQDFPKMKAFHLFNYKKYFLIDLDIKKENGERLWIIDQMRISKYFINH